jgi:HEAT repeat protein
MITGSQPAAETVEPIADPADTAAVEEVLRAVAAALRSYRLYDRNNPMVARFVAVLRQKLADLWERMPELRLQIEEHSIRWEGQMVYPTGEAGGDLPFTFFKDGIRELTVLPGFEEKEVLSLLNVLARAPAVREEEDDLITLLWQEDLLTLRYRSVEATADGVELHEGSPEPPPAVDPETLRDEAATPIGVSTDDFEEALYFLDEAELRVLRDEVRREAERDLWGDVLHALLDLLEDGKPDRQSRIIGLLGELLPTTLATGQFDRGASVLEELIAIGQQPGVLSAEGLRETRDLFKLLATEETIDQLATLLEEAPERAGDAAVPRLLAFFPPSAILPLMRALERTQQPAVRRVFEGCIQRLAESGREELVALLKLEDPAVVASALVWIGQLKIGSAAKEVVRHLDHAEAAIRAAAIDAVVALGAASAANSIVPLLEDPVREVRITAARALGSLAFAPARAPLEASLGSKRLRGEADRTEKLAFFESYGRLAGQEGVALLDRILNNRSWMGRAETPEVRACAALALARIRHPSASESLNAAARDKDPVVRSAVARALRGEVA